eukprot:3010916-Pyramimonas_sp.AAC.1
MIGSGLVTCESPYLCPFPNFAVIPLLSRFQKMPLLTRCVPVCCMLPGLKLVRGIWVFGSNRGERWAPAGEGPADRGHSKHSPDGERPLLAVYLLFVYLLSQGQQRALTEGLTPEDTALNTCCDLRVLLSLSRTVSACLALPRWSGTCKSGPSQEYAPSPHPIGPYQQNMPPPLTRL